MWERSLPKLYYNHYLPLHGLLHLWNFNHRIESQPAALPSEPPSLPTEQLSLPSQAALVDTVANLAIDKFQNASGEELSQMQPSDEMHPIAAGNCYGDRQYHWG